MQFTIDQQDGFAILTFSFDGNLAPADIAAMTIPDVPLAQGIVISGRGPIWLFLALAHHFHPAQWVASHDPRLGGAIVAQSHSQNVAVGDFISLS